MTGMDNTRIDTADIEKATEAAVLPKTSRHLRQLYVTSSTASILTGISLDTGGRRWKEVVEEWEGLREGQELARCPNERGELAAGA